MAMEIEPVENWVPPHAAPVSTIVGKPILNTPKNGENSANVAGLSEASGPT
jgi:hypothetical protein